MSSRGSIVSMHALACALACAGEEPSADPGTETGACIDNECLSGLVCLSNLCVDPEATPDTESGATSSGSSEGESEENGPSSGPDPSVGSDPSSGDTTGAACVPVVHTPCDEGASDPFRALGLACPGEAAAEMSTQGSAAAIGVRATLGATDEWAPREGSIYAVLGSGNVAELDSETPADDMNIDPTYCNDDLGAEFDVGSRLPAPLSAMNVDGDCVGDPGILGTGDCSNTIEGQFAQGGVAHDYTELRVVADVPATTTSFSYAFAFFTTEYPFYFGSEFNDMYVAWLESERWTGNVSFDGDGNPISLNAAFVDFRDDSSDLPELAGTCMRQHAGTRWLSTVAPVAPGERVTLVFAIFDLSDSILDAFVFLDDFAWGCDETDRPRTDVE